ncbi:coiled-coil domain-containing protein [Jiangella rhizosphaerae]|uniref:Chromosome segregation ATPase n=1 Tax=Jiangella rhizosphaerae TaxID=2293569 RepID=A0A418KSH0_9ACTN|nr:chromosome segregation ATPase [Jiangella rhizosphaerae]RIQ27357.1 chromosome segregation ATPase [Jiangella rhizosphaerae]
MSAAAPGAFDVVGERVLVGVQVVDISRLSTHPVPMIGQGLVTVAGQGPKDSNGAGKSSFIAALSLLHADEQWKLASGAAGAAELLFTAELAAQEGRWSNVDRGYVIGVFAPPGGAPQDDAVTVWLRINRKAPYLDLRWTSGLHVPYGATESERAARVDELWAQLPRSNGRTDFHAGQLSRVLFGQNARCVSFLSTSVRSSQAANLLAQPLNDLPPHRIFDAIATLTGLDRELEHEQVLRSAEHRHRSEVEETERQIAEWESEVAVIEAGIARRLAARELLGEARTAWRSRCARHLLDGVERAAELRQALAELDDTEAALRQELEGIEDRLAALTDDDESARRFEAAQRKRNELIARDRELEAAQLAAAQHLDRLTTTQRQLTDEARAADGRTPEVAAAELAEARTALEDAIAAQAVARAAANEAARRVTAAESGDDVAAEQVERLRAAGLDAAALVDVVAVDPAERDVWEPRLSPYREAVVVARKDATKAAKALAGLPGSLLVLADGKGGERDLTTFLDAVAARAGKGAVVDEAAGVLAIGGFAEPITGQPARVAAAQEAHRELTEALDAAAAVVEQARAALARAETRAKAAEAAERAEALQDEIGELRAANAERQEHRDALAPELTEAEAAYAHELGVHNSREERITSLRDTRKRLTQTLREKEADRFALTEERDGLALLDREKAWGDSPDAARRHLLELPPELQGRTTTAWDEDATRLTDEVAVRCFPPGTPPEELTAELRELLITPNWSGAALETRVSLVAPLLRALDAHLRDHEDHDRHQLKQIAEQRARRTADLDAARLGYSEAEQTVRAHRTSLAAGIKTMLRKVAAEFDRLDQEYGGYGAGLDYPEPEPPSEPDKPWRWTVSPKWRRAEGQRMSAYTLRSNTAQMDEKAVKLVCAAALARGGDRPLLLILDELGRNLGKQHRREAVALFERIGNDHNITVVGALQDDMERYAIEASGLYIKLRRRSDTMAYNEEPVVVGNDANSDRVELLRSWMSSYRPGTLDVEGAGAP